MDEPLFNPNEKENQMASGTQDISLNLNNPSQSHGNDNSINTTPSSPQIQSSQLANANGVNIDRSNAKVKNGKIFLTDLNTFCIILRGPCENFFSNIFFFSGFASFILAIRLLVSIKETIIILASGIFSIFCIFISIIKFYSKYHIIYFIMGENSLTIIKKSALRKKEIIYNSGEIEKVQFIHQKVEYKNPEYGDTYNYKLDIISKNKGNKTIFFKRISIPFFTNEEIENFLCQINTHIETKM